MNIVDAIQAIGKGGRCGALLPNVRLQAGGAEAFGEEAVLAAFAASPFPFEHGDPVLVGTNNLAWFSADDALFADVYGDHVFRLWRIKPMDSLLEERGVDVPFDPDLAQARGSVFGRNEDHPELHATEYGRVVENGRAVLKELSSDKHRLIRARAYLFRAFSSEAATAGLFALHAVLDGERRSSGFLMAATYLKSGATTLIWDRTALSRIAEHEWAPRLIA